MNKSRILQAAVAQLQESFQTLDRASQDARSGATDDNTKSEGKYDTRSTESNYLADGQALQAQATLDAIAALDSFRPPAFTPDQPVALGALVRLDPDGPRPSPPLWFLLTPAGGGIEVALEEADGGGEVTLVTLVTPEAPVARQLLGQVTGTTIQRPPATIRSIS